MTINSINLIASLTAAATAAAGQKQAGQPLPAASPNGATAGAINPPVTGAAAPVVVSLGFEEPAESISHYFTQLNIVNTINLGENISLAALYEAVQSGDTNATRLDNRRNALGEKYILAWLLGRTLGIPDNRLLEIIGIPASQRANFDLLGRAIVNLRDHGVATGNDQSPHYREEYWLPHIAMVLVNEMDNPALLPQLKNVLANGNHWQEKSGKEREYLALQQIYAQFLEGHRELGLMQAENLLRQAELAKTLDPDDYQAKLTAAIEILEKIADARQFSALEGSGSASEKCRRLQTNDGSRDFNRADYLPPLMKTGLGKDRINDQLALQQTREYIAAANMLLGKAYMLQGSDLTDSAEVLAVMEKARPYLENIAPLHGLQRLEGTKALAENLQLQGYMRKNAGGDYLGYFTAANDLFSGIAERIADYNAQQLDYRDYPTAAYDGSTGRISFRGRAKSYTIGPEQRIGSLWAAQIGASTALLQAKLSMVLAGELTLKPAAPVSALLAGALTPAEIEELNQPAGISLVRLNQLQLKLLGLAADRLKALTAEQYRFPGGTPTALFRDEALADINITLTENYVRQAFILKEQGDAAYAGLFTKAKELISQILSGEVLSSEQTKAVAHLWQAKILLVEAGSEPTRLDAAALLAANNNQVGAVDHINAAINSGKLFGIVLSAARQTYADILSTLDDMDGAEAQLDLALAAYPNNVEALAAQADIRNWRGIQEGANGAIALYDRILLTYPHHPLTLRVELGRLEANMRLGEKYSAADIAKLEELVLTRILNRETPGSFLIPRAVEDLIEAYSTDESLHGRIIVIANTLLGLTVDPDCIPEKDEDKAPEEAARAVLAAALEPFAGERLPLRFQAKLYLKLAEVVSWTKVKVGGQWEKRYQEAVNLIERNIPDNLAVVIGGDRELGLLRQLLLAELAMRREEKILTEINGPLWNEIMASGEPDLIARLVIDQAEGYAYTKDFAGIVAFARQYLTADAAANYESAKLAAIRETFRLKGRLVSFEKFKFTLWQKLADALSWNKEYAAAAGELTRILEAIGGQGLPETFVTNVRARSHVALGDLYSYDWDGKDVAKARDHYLAAIELLASPAQFAAINGFFGGGAAELADNVISAGGSELRKETRIALAWSLFGLGEVRRYGEGLKNYDQSFQLYQAALRTAETVPEQSDDRSLLLARINLAIAKLEETEGHIDSSAGYLAAAYRELAKVENPTAELQSEFNASHLNVAQRTDPRLAAHTTMIDGYDGRGETQLTLNGELPLDVFGGSFGRVMRGLHLTAEEQMDFGPGGGNLYASYLGGKFYFDAYVPDFPLTLGLDGNVYTGGGAPGLLFFQRPDLRLTGSFWNKYFTADLASGLYLDNVDQSSVYLSAAVNYGWTDSKWTQGFRFPYLEYNHFRFGYNGEMMQRDQVGLGIRYDVELADWIRLNARLSGQYLSTPAAAPHQRDIFGLDLGVGVDIRIWKSLILEMDYSRQQNALYPLNQYDLGLTWQF